MDLQLQPGAALRPDEEWHLQRAALDDNGRHQQHRRLDRRQARAAGRDRHASPQDHADGA